MEVSMLGGGEQIKGMGRASMRTPAALRHTLTTKKALN
jgi:hypothetical protein